MSRKLCFWMLLLISFGQATAQTNPLNNEVLLEKLDLYKKSHPENVLFVHTDKTIYTNNETIWFSAYLIKSPSTYAKKHTILSVSLFKDDNRQVILLDKYKMENGLSFGSISLPDSIPPGNYQLVASTNILNEAGEPTAVYHQPLTIKSIAMRDFNATVSLLDSTVNNNAVRAEISVFFKEPKTKGDAFIEYNVGKAASQSIILKQGTSLLTIPESQLNQPEPVLFTTVKYNGQVQYLSLKLPEIEPRGIKVRFFPEGGNLSQELGNRVGWEARMGGNLPVAIKGILYENDLPLDTVVTNSYGIGSFRLKPKSKSRYTLKIATNNFLPKDTVFPLPEAVENGLALHLPNAVVNDTLLFNISSMKPRNVQVLIHNYREAFASFKVECRPSGSKCTVALPGLPKGVATITVLDEEGRPVAERLFLAHYNWGIEPDIRIDKKVYDKEEKVKVKIRLNNQNREPVQGLISVAVVQENRIEGNKQRDIESYLYLSALGPLPPNSHGRGFSDKEYLENIFLVKGWRRYTWQDLIRGSAKDTVQKVHSPMITAQVTHNEKPLKEAVTVSVIRDSLIDLITTDTEGAFVLDPDALSITEGKKVTLFVNPKNREGYKIEVSDPFIQINKKLAEQIEIPATGRPAPYSQNSKDQELKGMENTITLNEVIINGNKGDNSLYGTPRVKGPNACGDYVDEWGYLNYEYSANSNAIYQPVKGKEYKIRTDINGYGPGIGHTFSVRTVIYEGCTTPSSNTLKIDGIYTSREFYGVDIDQGGTTTGPQYRSTLFWKPGLITNEEGEAEFDFITGDITGRFRLTLQGISSGDAIFGTESFTVK